MNTKNILTLTLLATALTLNAAIPRPQVLTTKQQSSSISKTIANILYKRGVDEDKAHEISNNFINGKEELFTLMTHNLLNSSIVTKEELLNQLSLMALQKKQIDLSSYSSLVKLTYTIKNNQLNSETLKTLEEISTKNSMLSQIYA